MRRFILLGAGLAVLVLPSAAAASPTATSARVIELGTGGDAAKSTCPSDPCQAIGRVTGYQGRSGALRSPFVIPRRGKIVAFTITLPKLTSTQMTYFNGLYGGDASVRLSILRRGKKRKHRLDHRLIRQSPVFDVSHFFGASPSFALEKPLLVGKDYIVALTVPTWAPAFAYSGLTGSNWWRSSRQKGRCTGSSAVTRHAQHETVGNVLVYGCTYHNARLLYTATYVPDPQPTDKTGK